VNLRMHGFRGLFGLLSMLFYFTAIARLPFLGDAVLITFLSPLLVAAIARPILGEEPVPMVWAALLLGLAGVGLVVGPSGALEPIGTIAAALSAGLAACAYVSVSLLTRTDSTSSVVLWFSVWCVVWTAPSLVVGGASEVPLQLVAVGVLGTGGQWALTRAYASGPAAQVAVFAYATPVFAYGLGILTLSEWPPLRSIAGAAVVIAAGLMAGLARPKPSA
jgi:drug/metabolite transporter (DMT)-like permease